MDTKPEQKTQHNDESDDVLASGGESADDAAFDDDLGEGTIVDVDLIPPDFECFPGQSDDPLDQV